MNTIIYIDRLTKRKETEQVYGGRALQLLYGDHFLARLCSPIFLPFVSKNPCLSAFVGYLQKRPASAKKIKPFIDRFGIDTQEFLESPEKFRSFNDFFIRKLKPEARPINSNPAVIPADGRYYFYQNIRSGQDFIVKGKKLNLAALLQDENLAKQYDRASVVVARLCPTDYHRFHFPCDCLPGKTRWINGWLYSVNPIAVKKNINIFVENKRTICELQTKEFGKVLYLEIGATTVGSIKETYVPFTHQSKGAEKGYFEFGASALILLFPEGSIQFDADLIQATQEGFEIRCLMGQSMGKQTKI